MLRASLGLLALSLAPGAFAEPGDESPATLECQACTLATKELLKAQPVLRKPAGQFREGDKEMALADAMPSFCSSGVFGGYAVKAGALVDSCKSFLKTHNAGGKFEAAIAADASPSAAAACATACAGVPEAQHEPEAAKAKGASAGKAAGGSAGAAKGKKADARAGTVNDPAYAAALKKKKARDAKRAAAHATEDAAGAEGAAAPAAAAAAAADADAPPPAADAEKPKPKKAKKKAAPAAEGAAPAADAPPTEL